MEKMKTAKIGFIGHFVIRKYKAGTKELLWESPVIKNLVVSSDTYGRNLIMRQLIGDTTYPIEIDSAAIGTGGTVPTAADTDLETPVLTGIAINDSEIANNEIILTFLMTDAQLADGTYKEFGLFMDSRLFARALITPNYTKVTGEDTSVDYTITLGAS